MNTIEVKTLKKLSLALVRELIEKYDSYRSAPQTYKFAKRFERLALVARFCRAPGFARLLEVYRDVLQGFEREKDESLRQKGGLEICAALNLFGVELSNSKPLPLVSYSRIHQCNKEKIQVFSGAFKTPFASIDALWYPRIDASEHEFRQSLERINSSDVMMNSDEFIKLHEHCTDGNAAWLISIMSTLVENQRVEWAPEVKKVVSELRVGNYASIFESGFPERAFDYIIENSLSGRLHSFLIEEVAISDEGHSAEIAPQIEDIVKFISAINSLKEAWISASSSMNFGTILKYTKEFKKKAHKLKDERFARLCTALADATDVMKSRNEETDKSQYTEFVDQLISFFIDGAIAIQVINEIVQSMKNNTSIKGIDGNVSDIEEVLNSYSGKPEHKIIEFPESLLEEIREKSNKLLVKKMIDNFELIKSVLDGKFAEISIKSEVNLDRFSKATYSMISDWLEQVRGISNFMNMVHLSDSCTQIGKEILSHEIWISDERKDRLVHGIAEIVLHLESIDYPMPEDMGIGILLREEEESLPAPEVPKPGGEEVEVLVNPELSQSEDMLASSESIIDEPHAEAVEEQVESPEQSSIVEAGGVGPEASFEVSEGDPDFQESDAVGRVGGDEVTSTPSTEPELAMFDEGHSIQNSFSMAGDVEEEDCSKDIYEQRIVENDKPDEEVLEVATIGFDQTNPVERVFQFEAEGADSEQPREDSSLEERGDPASNSSPVVASTDLAVDDDLDDEEDDFSIFNETPIQRDEAAIFSNENRFDLIPDDVLDAPDHSIVRVLLDEIDSVEPQIAQCILTWRENLLDNAQVLSCMENLKRHVHTIKGACRTVGFMRSGYVLHLVEDEMDMLLDAPPVAVLDLYEEVISAAIDAVRNYRFGSPDSVAEKREAVNAATPGVDQGSSTGSTQESESIRVSTKVIEDIGLSSGEVAILNSRTISDLDFAWRSMDEMSRNLDRLQSLLKEVEIQAEVRIEAGKEVLNDAIGRANFDPLELDRYTRLHEITKALGENILDIMSSKSDLSSALNRIDEVERKKGYLTDEIQSEAGRLMVVPFVSQRARIERVVSKACRATRKLAKVTLFGDMDIPSVLCEKVMPVLEHIFRNSITHGIETPNARIGAGKKETGNVYVHIQPNGGQCLIKIRDDGAGIDPVRILDKAIEKGLATPSGKYDQDDIYNFLFMSGFSTAESVTELAGRGVGLDAVKQSVTELGGTISIESVKGEYTEFSINIPIDISTATVIPVLCGDYQFMIPSSLIVKVVSTLSSKVSAYNDGDDIILDGLNCKYMQARSLIGEVAGKSKMNTRGFTNFVICSTDGTNLLALHVDHVDTYRKIVVRPVSRHISRISGIVAATVTGDGTPSLIINPIRMKPVRSSLNVVADQDSDTKVILMADDSSTVRMVTSRFLRKQGFEVIEAVDGLEALEHIKNGARPDLFMLDIEMPRMDGFELTEAIRKNQAVMNTPIVMITSRIAQKHRDHAIKLGVNEYIGKPYEEKELLSVIKKYLYTEKDYL